MRSTTFAILGITTAMCLGIVAIVAQQGFPVLPGLPLPGLPAEQSGQVDDAKAVAVPRTSPNRGIATEAPVADARAGGGGPDSERSGSSGIGGSRQLASDQDPVPSEPAADGAPSEEPPVAPAPTAPPPSEVTVTATAPPPALPIAVTPPGKGTAAVDTPKDEEGNEEEGNNEESHQGDSDEGQDRRDSNRGRKGGRPTRQMPPPSPSPVPPPAEEDSNAPDEEAAEVEYSPTPAEADEDSARSRGRGHGYRRFGR